MLKKLLIFCFFTLLIGAIYIYPDIRFILEEGNNFKGITLTATADEAFYLAKLNAVYNGNYKLSSVGLYEHIDDLCLIPPFYEMLIGFAGKKMNIPVPYLDIILSFIFPAVIFWLIYILIYCLSGSRALGILGGSIILFGCPLITHDINIFKQVICFRYSQPLWFLRPFSPQFIYIPFILSFILIFLNIDTSKKWKLILTSVLIALLNYLQPFLWAFIFAGLIVLFFISFLRKQSVVYKNIIFVLLLSFLLSLPYWVNYYKMMLSPNYEFYQQLFGVESSHRPIIPLSYILIGTAIVFLNIKSNQKTLYFLLSFLIGGLICLNQQIVTGKIIGLIYLLSYAGKIFLIFGLIASLKNILRFKRPISLVIFIFFMIFLGFSAAMQQNNYYNANKKTYSDLQAIKGAITWLNENTKKDDVILTDSIRFPSFVFIRTLLLYVKNYHYLGFEIHSMISREELEHRILSAMRFYGYSLEEADSVFRTSGGVIFFGLSASYGIVKDRDVKEYISRLEDRYADFISKDPIVLLKRYRIDYVLIGKNDHLFDTVENRYPSCSKVFEDGNYKVIKIY